VFSFFFAGKHKLKKFASNGDEVEIKIAVIVVVGVFTNENVPNTMVRSQCYAIRYNWHLTPRTRYALTQLQ
jgi:hypothetical protein